MFWKREQRDPIEGCADALYAAVKGAVTQGGRIRVEDLISAAAICGGCLEFLTGVSLYRLASARRKSRGE
jgi:hypothetical protein